MADETDSYAGAFNDLVGQTSSLQAEGLTDPDTVITLQPGRYWSDLLNEEAHNRWTSWAKNVANSGGKTRVRVLATEHFEAEGDHPARDWILWEVLLPVMYDSVFYAPANPASAAIESSDDTVTKPEPTSTIGFWKQTFGVNAGPSLLAGVAVGVGGLGLVLLLFRGLSGRRQ